MILGELGKDAAEIAVVSFQNGLGLGLVDAQSQKGCGLDVPLRLLSERTACEGSQ